MIVSKTKKIKSQYECVACGYVSSSWYGKCPLCSAWNSLTFKEKTIANTNTLPAVFFQFSNVKHPETVRIKTFIPEWDNVLGGGMVLGECILLGGEPGIGKSTLLTSILNNKKALYVCGEEYPDRIYERMRRLKIKPKEFLVTEETDTDKLHAYFKSRNDLSGWICVVDSIQTLRSSSESGLINSMNQMRDSVINLISIGREKKMIMIFIGHVTKGGELAGPKMIEHAVDCVLYLEGERSSSYRLLRSYKNRFGTSQELGVMRMTDHGFESVFSNSLFIHSEAKTPKTGLAVSGFVDGGKIIFVEVQSLVVPTYIPVPRRVIKGVDYNKILLLLAVMKKHAGFNFDQHDVFVNLAEGFETKSTSCDLAICFSLYSALKNIPLPSSILYIGEVSLLGDVRPVREIAQLVKQAKKLGFTQIISHENFKTISNIEHILKSINA